MSRTEDVDLVLVNPGARTDIYQSLGKRLTAVENPIWAGLDRHVRPAPRLQRRNRGCRGRRACPIPDRRARRPIQTEARGDRRLRPSAVCIHAEHDRASLACTAIRERIPDARILMLGGHVAALPERTLAEEACDFVAHDEGLHTIVDLLEADRQGDRSLDKIRGLDVLAGRGAAPDPLERGGAAREGSRRIDMPGVAWDLLPMDKYRAHNWHCFGHPSASRTRPSTRRWVPCTSARSAASRRLQGRREGAGAEGDRQFVPVLEPAARHRGDRSARQQLRRAEHQVRRRDVRAERPPCRRASAI